MKRNVVYFYDNEIGTYSYGYSHPMKPLRMKLAHELIVSLGIDSSLAMYAPSLVSEEELLRFHSDDYVYFLQTVGPENAPDRLRECQRFNVDSDSPAFAGLYEFCCSYASSSLQAAQLLNSGQADIAVNWAGGLHHAKRAEASGFCYINDIVLAIAELLKTHARVLYVDIDVHHGDGVEEAFYLSDRVLTLSLHRYGDFFPGTGAVEDSGAGKGVCRSLNVPLQEGASNEIYASVFQPLLERAIACFRPEAIVMQCGTDSLAHDRLGCFNLTSEGHADCVRMVRSLGLPLLCLGGGGYTVRNVARCWALETAVLIGKDKQLCAPGTLVPPHAYSDYYAPDYLMAVESMDFPDKNEEKDLHCIKEKLFEKLNHVQATNSAFGSQTIDLHSNPNPKRMKLWEA